MHALPEQVADDVSAGDSILLSCPTFGGDELGACLDLLTFDGSAPEYVLWISLRQSVDDRIQDWTERTDLRPGAATYLDVRSDIPTNEGTPNAADDSDLGASFGLSKAEVAPPSDFTALGVRITEQLEAWRAEPSDSRIVVCFDSISMLLQYANRQQTVKFLQILTEQLTATNAISHFHFNPKAHDTETVELLTEVFDWACVYDDGEWTIQPDSNSL